MIDLAKLSHLFKDETSLKEFAELIRNKDGHITNGKVFLCGIYSLGHTSNPEFEPLKANDMMEVLRDRTIHVEVPKLLLTK